MESQPPSTSTEPAPTNKSSWFVKTLLALAVIVVALLAVIAMQPSEYSVTRKATVNAPPAEVFSQVNDFHNWEAWSPWAERDPEAVNSFEGAAEGEGAIFRWAGNSEVGEGSMTILESRPSEMIKIKLDFVKPFEDTSTSEFSFQPEDDQTVVTWSMYGKNNFMAKAVCLFMDMDEMIGNDFEQGLANMKKVVESTP